MTNRSPAVPPRAKKIAIVQSNYIPWKGYFDLINAVDEFVLYDDMQFTRRDWRNRNLIKTPTGTQWLTIPVEVKGKYLQKIKDTRVSDPRWGERHWAAIRQNYARSRYFDRYAEGLAELYREAADEPSLSRVNHLFLTRICSILGIKTRITWSMGYGLVEGKTERLVGLCKATGATHYLSGPSAMDYIERSRFSEARIVLEFMDYASYPQYPQLWGPFEHGVTILDLILNAGPEAPQYMKTFHQAA